MDVDYVMCDEILLGYIPKDLPSWVIPLGFALGYGAADKVGVSPGSRMVSQFEDIRFATQDDFRRCRVVTPPDFRE